MNVRLVPQLRRLDVSLSVPGSKSIANRAVMCGALADGRSTFTNVPDGDDTAAMLEALRRLGVDIATSEGGSVTIAGGHTDWPATTVNAGLAGTTSRFLTALAARGAEPVTIDGRPPLRARPFAPLHDALASLGAEIEPGERSGHLPVTVRGPLTGDRVSIRGDVSSQYVSALMMIAPGLPRGLTIALTSPLVSVPYVELTADILARFGVAGVRVGRDEIVVPASPMRAIDLAIEPDASSASYPLALAAVVGGRVSVPGLGLGALQGDARFADLLGRMGCGVTRTAAGVTVESGGSLRGIDVDMADISDLVPTVAAVAVLASSPTRIRGVGFIRAKESDRLGDLAAELRTLGATIDETEDGLHIQPSADRLHGGRVATHHDHRLAMSFGVLGARVPGVEVAEPDVVAKSWPGFWAMLDGLAP